MKRSWVGDRLLCGAIVLSMLGGLPGCSFLFVQRPKSAEPTAPEAQYAPSECTSSKVAPAFDTVFAGLEAARTVYAATAPSSVYEGAPISRGADIAFGLGFLALFGASAIYGYSVTSACARLHGHHPAHVESPKEPEEHEALDENGEPRPRAAAPKAPTQELSP
ncbi:MAG TPA: hypothetical protein VFK05_35495 [Polyangiaceae bacterium]|nr:hypothetical protein [Polyangiaceae bacterium]